VHDRRARSRQAEVRAVGIYTRVVGEALGVVAEADLAVGLQETSNACENLRFPIALEPGARNQPLNTP
jgi:hypothetical protein